MNQIKLFDHQEFGQVRIVELDGKPYAVGVDVARALEYAKPSQAVIDHCKGIRKLGIPSQGGVQETNIIPEGDIYRLVVKAADQSKSKVVKAKAERFESWIFDTVLPTIRKTGGYVANEDLFIQTYLPYADETTKMLFKATLETVRQQNEKIAVLQPKADYFDALVDRNLLTSFRDTAKELEVKESFLINWLLENKYIYRDQKGKLCPYARYVPDLFKVKEWERNGKAGTQTLVTPKGKETFRLLLKDLAMSS
ncbi:phage antirepressor Ant [Brevibacillus massiliensis]|uniref:phage antirepressor Ant n=1 Tax=Brevibacillus massiliensis TaxID=1118054 RepID=UPI000374B364|nr:phage antirepressor Ant [Brevibacillus massiliensis]